MATSSKKNHNMATLPDQKISGEIEALKQRYSYGQTPIYKLTKEQMIGLRFPSANTNKDPIPLEELLKEPKAGPRPITIEEYRRRLQQGKKQVPSKSPTTKKRRRGGALTRFKKQLGQLHKLIVVTQGAQFRQEILNKIKKIERERDDHQNRHKKHQ